MSNSLNSIALSAVNLMDRVQEIARQHVAETRKDRRDNDKARDMHRSQQRKIKGRIHAFSTAD